MHMIVNLSKTGCSADLDLQMRLVEETFQALLLFLPAACETPVHQWTYSESGVHLR